MAYRWFGDDERAVAISFGALGTPVGCMMGLLLGPQFISEIKKVREGSSIDRKEGRLEVDNYLFWHAVIDTMMCVPVILFFVEKPKHFPSLAAKNMGKKVEK